jgi:hypothetical protein
VFYFLVYGLHGILVLIILSRGFLLGNFEFWSSWYRIKALSLPFFFFLLLKWFLLISEEFYFGYVRPFSFHGRKIESEILIKKKK